MQVRRPPAEEGDPYLLIYPVSSRLGLGGVIKTFRTSVFGISVDTDAKTGKEVSRSWHILDESGMSQSLTSDPFEAVAGEFMPADFVEAKNSEGGGLGWYHPPDVKYVEDAKGSRLVPIAVAEAAAKK